MENNEYKIIIAGDLLPSGKNVALFKEGDSKALFGEELCRMFASADYSILNLEGPLTDSDSGMPKVGPVVKAPVTTINGIKALGVKAVSLANNHVTDYGAEGYSDTIGTLEAAGIEYVGAGENEASVKRYLTVLLGEHKVCLYCVSETFFNEPTENAPGAYVYDEYVVCNDIRELKATHDFVIVLYHGGSSYFQYPTPKVMKRMHRMADSGADVITAQHTHCIGCEEHYHNSYLLYGQGNFLFARQKAFPALTKEGLVLEIRISKGWLEVNKHHVVITQDECVMLNPDYDFAAFNERCAKINDKEMLINQYRQLKYSELSRKYMEAYKGNHLFLKIFRKLFPKRYITYLAQSYSKEDLYRCWTVANGDRMQEDVKAMWEYIYYNIKRS